jgi:hypothetical protein
MSDTGRSFTSALGSGRGSTRDDLDIRPVTPRGRAREFFRWAIADHPARHSNRVEYLRAEQAKADELRLVVLYGHWQHLDDGSGDADETVAWVFDRDDGEPLAVMALGWRGGGRLYFEDTAV